MFALLIEPYAKCLHFYNGIELWSVAANFIPSNFGLFRWNPWQPLMELWLKNTDLDT